MPRKALLPSALLLVASLVLGHAPTAAQTISGMLLDGTSNRPIDLGTVVLYTEAGDSVASSLTDAAGRFSLHSPEPGGFLLVGSALGYRERTAGVFELGDGGSMTVEFRLAPRPLVLDSLVVESEQASLVRNGFVQRSRMGFGRFITPSDIERSPAHYTEDLLLGIPGVTVRPAGALGSAQQIVLRGTTGRACAPRIYVDGMNVRYAPDEGMSLDALVPLETVEAVEVYRRPVEIPMEYQKVGSGGGCGVILVWTERGG